MKFKLMIKINMIYKRKTNKIKLINLKENNKNKSNGINK